MRDRYEELRSGGAEALVISFARPEDLEGFREHLRLPFPIAADPSRDAYAAYGVGSGPAWRIWGPRVIWRYMTLVARGRKLQRPAKGEDLSQLGADFVLDAKGRLVYAHLSRSPADRPPVARLIAALGL